MGNSPCLPPLICPFDLICFDNLGKIDKKELFMTPLLSKIRQFGLFLLLAYVYMGNASLQAGEAQDLLGQAFSAYQQQQWSSAIAPLERALALYPGYAEAHHLVGLFRNKLEKPDKAIIELQRAVEAYPHFAQA